MNTLTGKSVGIALLMAAALLAALFAMGVFAPAGAGADNHDPTITSATFVEGDANADPPTTDKVVINLANLRGVAANTDNDINITMQDVLGSGATAAWSGGSQFGASFTVPAYTDTAGDVPGHYAIDMGETQNIAAGTATLEITLGTGNTVDTNAKITAMTIGNGAAGSVTLNTITGIPDDGMGFANAPTGPTIEINPTSATQGDTGATQTVKLTGMGYETGAAGTVGNISISGTGVTAISVDADSLIDASQQTYNTQTGAFSTNVVISTATLGKVTVSAEQTGKSTATAVFTVNPVLPARVANVMATNLPESVLVSWDKGEADTTVTPNVPAADGYQVYWRLATDAEGSADEKSHKVDDENITSYLIPGLTPGALYIVQVAALLDHPDSTTADPLPELEGVRSSVATGVPAVTTVVVEPEEPEPELTISHAPDEDMVFDPGATKTQSHTVSGMINGTAELGLDFSVSTTDADVATAKYSKITDTDDNVTGATVTVTPVGPGRATIMVTATTSDDSQSDTTEWEVTVLGVTSSTNLADKDVVLEIFSSAGTEIRGGRDIVVGLPGYFIPEGGIDEDDVLVDGHAADSYYGNPADVTVSGSNVTITIPTKVVGQGGQSIDTQINAGNYTIRFKDGADLRNPNSAGNKTITVGDSDASAQEMSAAIISHISVKPGWVSRGDTFTITGKGINAAGDTTAHLYIGSVDPDDLTNDELVESSVSIVLGTEARDGGTVVVEDISTTPSDFEAEATDASENPDKDAKGTNLIVMVDAAGEVVGYTYLGLLPSVSLDVSDVRRTGEVKVSVSDWYYGDEIDLVRINGITVNLPDNTQKPNDEDSEPDNWIPDEDDPESWDPHKVSVGSDGKETFTVVVDRDTRLGEMQVDLRGWDSSEEDYSRVKQGSAGSIDIHKQTVQVGFFPLTITPSTAVTEQVIQIEGEEFLPRTCITSIEVGERTIDEATNGDTVGADDRDCVDTDSNGKLTVTFLVPRGLKPGTYSVVVRDDGNRVGEAELVVPKPAITLDPMTSQRGSTVTVVGENFPADDVVTIAYRGITVEAAQTDTVGNFRATFQVPITAPIGADHTVVVTSEHKADDKLDPPKNAEEVLLTASEEHRVSDETLEVSPAQVAPGQQLSINAGNLPLFTPVSISIGGRDVAGKVLGEENASDGFGGYVDSVLVPQLPPGTTLVELTVHTIRGDDVRVATFVDITNIITRPTDEVFADLIAAGQLTSVWRYRIDETGSDWDSYDPQFADEPGINDLQLVSTRDIVWIRVTENVIFQGAPLYAGWNLRTLE